MSDKRATGKRKGGLPPGIRRGRHGVGYQARIRIRGQVHTKTYAELAVATAWLDEMRGRRGRRLPVPSKDMGQPFGEYLRAWLAEQEILHAARPTHTYPTRERALRNYVLAFPVRTRADGTTETRALPVCAVPLHDLDEETIAAAYRLIAERNPRAVGRVHEAFHVALQRLVAKGDLPRNPATQAPRIKVERPERDPWTEEEAAAFEKVAKTDRYFAAYLLALRGGLRKGEAFALEERDVDAERRGVKVNKSLTYLPRLGWIVKPTKTKRSRRFVSLDAETMTALRSVIQRNREERLAAKPGTYYAGERSTALFRHGPRTGAGGNRLAPGTPVVPSAAFSERFKDLCAAAGVRKIAYHDLRHTFASVAIRRGADLYRLSRRLGHSTVAVTEGVYLDWIDGDDRAIADLFGPSGGADVAQTEATEA